METIDAIAKILNVSIPTGLVVIGLWFAVFQLWPYLRDVEFPARREHEQSIWSIQRDVSSALLQVAQILERLCDRMSPE